MDTRLARLISDFLASVNAALHLMVQSGILLPSTSAAWIDSDIPQYGNLDGGIEYRKHGVGCEVKLSTGAIDFDFGENGEVDGFDLWRLTQFAGSGLKKYEFESKNDVQKSFGDAKKSGAILYNGTTCYYIADSAKILSVEVLKILKSEYLPHQTRDSIYLLYTTCYLPADVMHDQYVKLQRKLEKVGRLSQSDRVKFRVYGLSWLGYLRSTCEGFDIIGMRSLLEIKRPKDFHGLIEKFNAINSMHRKCEDYLRKLRNDVFHLRANNEAIENFFYADPSLLTWASDLYSTIGSFLSEYRISCEVHYMLHHRFGESQLSKKRIMPSERFRESLQNSSLKMIATG